MEGITVQKYSSEFSVQWNDFVKSAKNATFLFNRDFMEYHSDRFQDYSLMVFKNEKLVGLLPATQEENKISSHSGLSYGALIVEPQIKFPKLLEIFSSLLEYLHLKGFNNLLIKQIPEIYCSPSNGDMVYLYFLVKANLVRRDALSVVDLEHSLEINSNRLEGVKRGQKHNLRIEEVDEFKEFWSQILIPNLFQKHGVVPVHTLEEIVFLKNKFPDNIRQFNVYHDGQIVAGTTIFESQFVAHSQYISGNDQSNELGSLDFLYKYLINEVFGSKRYFDFGNSNENEGKKVNKGLQFWKEGFGARTIPHNFYSIATANYKLLEKVFI